MAPLVKHYGWVVSPYSTKTRSYLRYKDIRFEDIAPSAWDLYRRIQKAVGRAIMPTVELEDGTWLQDSSDIIDALERRQPEPHVVPRGPRQAFVSALLELYADEWLPMLALHYRWNIPVNRHFAVAEFARYGFPKMPAFVGHRLAKPVADRMRGYLPLLGVSDDAVEAVESHAAFLLSTLDRHLAEHAFLLGERPCVADFAVFGPLQAHLYRDPGSTHLFDNTPHVRAWLERMRAPRAEGRSFVGDDQVPSSLDPLLASIVSDTLSWVATLVAAIDAWCEQNPTAARVPRALGYADFRLGDFAGRRKLITFVQYKAQRPIGRYAEASESARAAIDALLERACGQKIQLPLVQNPLERHAFKVRLKNRT